MKVKVGYIQQSCSDNLSSNYNDTLSKIRDLAKKGCQVICTQELFKSKYFCLTEDSNKFCLAEKIPGDTTKELATLAKELNIVIIASLFEKRTEGVYHNTSVVIDVDGSIGKYRKMHIPDDPGYYEKYYFTPGDLGYPVFDTKYGKIAVLICFDQWFPEAARAVALKGAQLIVYPTAIGWCDTDNKETHQEELNAWKTIQQSHAIANGVFVMAVNRVGVEGETKFWGNSFVSNPFGTIITESGTDEAVNMCEIDYEKITSYRHVWPFFRDRRIDSYTPLLKRFDDEV